MISLYIHIPWCLSKCNYCDYNSYKFVNTLPEQSYADALFADLEQDIRAIGSNYIISSLFFGGGTPSIFSIDTLGLIISSLRAKLQFSHDLEITIEANPKTINKDKCAALLDIGINRLSIGVQSFYANYLQILGRTHSSHDTINSIEAAYAAGFNNINLDLIIGLPAQSIKQAISDVQLAVILEPTHLSIYQLEIKNKFKKYLAKNHIISQLPDIDTQADMQEQIQDYLESCSYDRYEISAYAKNQHVCRHNINYWEFGDYLGLGAGAHSKITINDTVKRFWKVNNPTKYINYAHTPNRISGSYVLNYSDLAAEFMMNALRLVHGVPTELFQKRTYLPISNFTDTLNELRALGLINNDDNKLQATELGLRFLNDIVQFFLSTKC